MPTGDVRALVELVRLPAVLSVPGDVLTGAALSGTRRPPARTLGLCTASAALYLGGMALNDWADREVDAVERPGRPIPSGRVAARTALAVATGLSGAGLAVAGLAGGRRSLATAGAVAAAAWTYDLSAKSTPAGPATMAAARALDVLLGGSTHAALPGAAVVALHTAVTTQLSGHEAGGGTAAAAERALAGTALVTGVAALLALRRAPGPVPLAAALGLLAAYAHQVGGAQDAARRTPDAATIQAAVGAGVVGLALLEAALLAASGTPGSAVAVTGLHLLARSRRRAVT